MVVVRLSLLIAMCHTGLCNCTGCVTQHSRFECGGLKACGVGQLHQPVPTPITRPVLNHTESQCTVIYGYIHPTGCSVHSILPSLSQKSTAPTVAVRPVPFCSFKSLLCLENYVPLKNILLFLLRMPLYGVSEFGVSFWNHECWPCRRSPWTEVSSHCRTTQNRYTRPYSRVPRGIRTHDSIVRAAVHNLDCAFTGNDETWRVKYKEKK
jgi:hypothetical protein